MGWGVRDYPAPPDPEPAPRCPVCGAECARIYRDHSLRIVGCDECIDDLDAWDWKDGAY